HRLLYFRAVPPEVVSFRECNRQTPHAANRVRKPAGSWDLFVQPYGRGLAAVVDVRLAVTLEGQRSPGRVVALARHEQFFGRKFGDYFGAVGGDNELLLDAGCTPPVGRWPVGLQGE